MSEECQRCKEVGEDRRTLWMSCFYEMSELGLPFDEVIIKDEVNSTIKFFNLRVCKDCRSQWMHFIKLWFDMKTNKQESCGSGIFVRDLGATVEITREEWDKRAMGKEPVIWKPEKESNQ